MRTTLVAELDSTTKVSRQGDHALIHGPHTRSPQVPTVPDRKKQTTAKRRTEKAVLPEALKGQHADKCSPFQGSSSCLIRLRILLHPPSTGLAALSCMALLCHLAISSAHPSHPPISIWKLARLKPRSRPCHSCTDPPWPFFILGASLSHYGPVDLSPSSPLPLPAQEESPAPSP